jgi:hypothetical protein
MGEQDNKPIIDVKIPGWDSDKEWVRTFSKQCADLRGDKFGLESERDELKEQCDILRKDGVLKGQQCLKLKEDLNALKKEYGRVLSELAELKSKTVADFKAKKEAECKDCKYHCTAFWRVSIDGEGMAACRSPKTKYGFCKNNCNGEKACPEFEAKE